MAIDFTALLPDARDVRCPFCQKHAEYLTTLARRVFKRQTREVMEWLHTAPYPSGLSNAKSTAAWWNLQWFPKEARRNKDGILNCLHCGSRVAYDLQWPTDAWYQVEVHGQKLCAPDREMFELIRQWLDAGAKKEFLVKLAPAVVSLLDRLPRKLISGDARPEVVTQIDAFLKNDRR
ncbi:MAG: hypothetical protein IT462_09700 [Planctomycetes bacterium]|nr:hypothetical protein [Planctomycetota bacterium]